MLSVLDSDNRPAPSRQRIECSISTRAPSPISRRGRNHTWNRMTLYSYYVLVWMYINTLFLALQSPSSRAISSVLRAVSPRVRNGIAFSFRSSSCRVSRTTLPSRLTLRTLLHPSQNNIFSILAVCATLPLSPVTRDLSATPSALLIRRGFLVSVTTFFGKASPPFGVPLDIRTLHFRWSMVKVFFSTKYRIPDQI